MMKVLPQQLRLYAVTDSRRLWGRTLLDTVAAALDGGATFVQLREKELSPAALLEEARALAKLCHARHVPFVVDDNVEVALAAGADGVHVGQSDMAARRARALLGPDKILGVSAHNAAEALAAQADGADYLGCGAAFVTGTKSDAAKQVGMNVAERAKAKGIETVVFDRGGYVYHGRVQALAEGAREGGLQF